MERRKPVLGVLALGTALLAFAACRADNDQEPFCPSTEQVPNSQPKNSLSRIDSIEEALENFPRIIDFMKSCDLPEIREAASKLAILTSYGFVEVSPYYFDREPVDVVYTGRADLGSGSYGIDYQFDFTSNETLSQIDQALYLMKNLYVFQKLSRTKKNITVNMLVNKHRFEAEGWLQILPIAAKVREEIRDPYIHRLLSVYEQSGPAGFIQFWRGQAPFHPPAAYL